MVAFQFSQTTPYESTSQPLLLFLVNEWDARVLETFFFERAHPRTIKNGQWTSGSFNRVTIPFLPLATTAHPSPDDMDIRFCPKNHPMWPRSINCRQKFLSRREMTRPANTMPFQTKQLAQLKPCLQSPYYLGSQYFLPKHQVC
jgi:hypothetical protein